MNVPKLIVHVEIVAGIDVPSAGSNPASTPPTMIVGPSAVPIPVPIQPCANNQARSKTDQAPWNYRSAYQVWITPDRFRIVFGDVDVTCLCRFDPNDIGLNDDLLLWCALKNAVSSRFLSQTLNRLRNIRRLCDVGLS
jgi:hypothetical protein